MTVHNMWRSVSLRFLPLGFTVKDDDEDHVRFLTTKAVGEVDTITMPLILSGTSYTGEERSFVFGSSESWSCSAVDIVHNRLMQRTAAHVAVTHLSALYH